MTELNPPPERLRAILRELGSEAIDDSAPDVWLTHLDSGWTLSVFTSGLLQLEADAPTEPLRELSGADFDKALDLWIALAEGNIDRVLLEPWREAIV